MITPGRYNSDRCLRLCFLEENAFATVYIIYNVLQEMLNHATSRVNESEHERALSEAGHRHTTAIYHKAEHEVQRLQRELKRTIAKSRYVYGGGG